MFDQLETLKVRGSFGYSFAVNEISDFNHEFLYLVVLEKDNFFMLQHDAHW